MSRGCAAPPNVASGPSTLALHGSTSTPFYLRARCN
ncbi:hypothetical protein TSAR_008855 [Trichomalopsis sarcophagae]|uniref:Uncharacterized protein n=1 Tax=Trichomalopsis sarcophagae TaxID=543379 RepID=A0A232ERG9_9HYME|nr:hypothetical protein TSAR_008855 [Trichomalopsis sarcophagae]